MNKILKSTMIAVLILVISIPIYAQNNNTSNNSSNNSNFIVTDISKDEYLKIRAEEEGITIEEAAKLDKAENEAILKRNAKKYPAQNFLEKLGLTSNKGIIREKAVSELFTYPGNREFKAQQTVIVKIWSDSHSNRQIESVWGHKTRSMAGVHDYKWNEAATNVDPLTCYGDPTSYPCCKIKFSAYGHFQVDVNVGIHGDINVIPGFFTVGTSTSTTRSFLSNDMFMQSEFSVY